MAETTSQSSSSGAPHGWSIESIQSLIVAFVVAMAFRSFVLEGFVIPTGSMAPTLMGAHLRERSEQTGYEFPVDAAPVAEMIAQGGEAALRSAIPVGDPMLGPTYPASFSTLGSLYSQTRFGDRVLVLKCLYPFIGPRRFDVVVFKNPTDPFGDTQNFIKRLVGMPNEKLLLLDGDVFTGPLDGRGLGSLRIQRKPEHVQRAVWQPVQSIDYQPVDLESLQATARRPWPGIPWRTLGWDTGDPRAIRWTSAGAGDIGWDNSIRQIDDWNAYNMLRGRFADPIAVSDVRVAAALDVDEPATFRATLTLQSRGHDFVFVIGEGFATVSVRAREGGALVVEDRQPLPALRAGRAARVECWHVDQALSIYIDGTRVAYAEYEWSPADRLRYAFSGLSPEDYSRNPLARRPTPLALRWRFEGSPLTVRGLRLDRDLYYRPGTLNTRDQFRSNGEFIDGMLYATDPLAPAELSPDHFLMLGDNSAASRDGRAWGRPHPLVAAQIGDDTPFLVHRKLLLGKAGAVYFPAMIPMSESGRAIIPDFGRLRFIR